MQLRSVKKTVTAVDADGASIGLTLMPTGSVNGSMRRPITVAGMRLIHTSQDTAIKIMH
jgi:hypothetical protein